MSETTLRDALSNALDAQEEADTTSTTQTPEVTTENVTTDQAKEGRARDEVGRFKATEKQAEPTTTTAPVVAPVVERKAPTSWKKEYWDAYQKLDPQVADYITQREQQFANGVSTYKQEADRAKEVFEAIAPFQQDLQAHGISAKDWIGQLGTAHQTLVRGSPEQKLAMFQRLAQDYGIPLQNIQSGQVDPLMQYLSPLQEQVRSLQGQLTGWQQQQRDQEQQGIMSEISAFSVNNEHFEAVRETMAGLLQAGLATDLKSAYDKAIRMNDDLWQASQQQQAAEAEKQRREAEQAKVNKARANAVSVRSATPIGTMTSGGKKDLRSALSEAVDAHLGGARV